MTNTRERRRFITPHIRSEHHALEVKRQRLEVAKRAAEKQAQRDQDAADIASGKRTVQEVQDANAFLRAEGTTIDPEHFGKVPR